MAEGFKLNALDVLPLPMLSTDEKIIGRGTKSYRTPVTTKYPFTIPLLVGVIDSGTHRCVLTDDPFVWWDVAEMPRYLNFSESSWADVIYIADLKLLFAVAALNNGGNRNVIAASRDGYRWSGRANDVTTVNTGIAYSPSLGRIVICRQAGTTTSNRIWTSSDGFAWVERALPTINVNGLNCIAWSPTLNLFVTMGASNTVFTSPDGITWTSRTGPTSGGGWRRVRWCGAPLNKFVAFDGNSIGLSADGIAWGAAINASMPGNGRGLAYSPSLNVLVICDANNNSTINHSSNGGVTWNTHTVTGTFHGIWQDVVWSDELAKFVAIGGFQIATSPDGSTWTVFSTTPFPQSSGVVRLLATR